MPLRFRYLLTTVALYVLTCHVRRASASQLGMGDRSSDFSQGANPVARGQEETPRSVGGRGYVQLCWAITSPALFGSTSSEPRQGYGAAARGDLGVLALSVKREPVHVAVG